MVVFQAEDLVVEQFKQTLARHAQAADRLNAHASMGTLIQQLLMGALVFLLLTIGGIAQTQAEMNARSEEHTSELQSRGHLVCRLLLEKKKQQIHLDIHHQSPLED